MASPNRLNIVMLALCGLLLGEPAGAASTERVSLNDIENQGVGASHSAALSGNGRFVAFVSDARNFVPRDTNRVDDIFVRDLVLGVVERVSVDSAELQGNRESLGPAISDDGRFVAFASYASNLVPGDTNGQSDVFVRDRLSGTTEKISEGIGVYWASEPSISGDGRFVAFTFDQFDPPGEPDVFVRDRQTGTTRKVGFRLRGGEPSISADGRFVAWTCLDDPNFGDPEICMRNLETDEIWVVSERSGNPPLPRVGQHGSSIQASVSANGRFVAFRSWSEFINPNPENSAIYVWDRLTRTTVGVNDHVVPNGSSSAPTISANGRLVAFESGATNLVPGETNGRPGIFVHDRLNGATRRISVGTAGNQADKISGSPSISANGRFVVFDSFASNLVGPRQRADTNADKDVFLRDQDSTPNDLAFDFGLRGLWLFLNNGTWSKIDNGSPSVLAAGDLDGDFKDELIAVFPGRGLLARYNNSDPWRKLHASVPVRLVAGDFDRSGEDDLAADFGTAGLWIKANKTAWRKVHTSSTKGLRVGDIDGDGGDELIANLGSLGLWARFDNATWVKLQTGSPIRIVTGDLDGQGQDEVIADFGGLGFWALYNNTLPWTKLPETPPGGPRLALTSADLNYDGWGSGGFPRDDLISIDAAGVSVLSDNRSAWHFANDIPGINSVIATTVDHTNKLDDLVLAGEFGVMVMYNNVSARILRPWLVQAMIVGGFD